MSHLNKKSVWRKSRWSLAVTGLHPSKTNSVSLSEDSPTSSRPQAHPPPPRPSGPRWPPRSRHPRPIADSLSRWLTDPQCRPHWRLKRWEIGIWVLLLCVFCLAESVIHAVIFLILFWSEVWPFPFANITDFFSNWPVLSTLSFCLAHSSNKTECFMILKRKQERHWKIKRNWIQ